METEIIPPEILEIFKAKQLPLLKSEDISEAVIYVLGTPPHVQVSNIEKIIDFLKIIFYF